MKEKNIERIDGYIETKKFYENYITLNKPLVIPGGCNNWTAC